MSGGEEYRGISFMSGAEDNRGSSLVSGGEKYRGTSPMSRGEVGATSSSGEVVQEEEESDALSRGGELGEDAAGGGAKAVTRKKTGAKAVARKGAGGKAVASLGEAVRSGLLAGVRPRLWLASRNPKPCSLLISENLPHFSGVILG